MLCVTIHMVNYREDAGIVRVADAMCDADRRHWEFIDGLLFWKGLDERNFAVCRSCPTPGI